MSRTSLQPTLICFPFAEFDGPTNMALDELLWQAAAGESLAYFRTYGWLRRPWVSLGRFQDAGQLDQEPGLASLPRVRRISGGGLIVHDNEITYAMALSKALAPERDLLYQAFHRAVQAELARWGIEARVGPGDGQPHASRARRREPLLCFQRTDRYGLYVNGLKVLGSAQRRSSQSVLMHGSLIIAASAALPAVPGLRQATGQLVEAEPLQAALERAAAAAIDIPLERRPMPKSMLEAARQLADTKYRHEWLAASKRNRGWRRD